MLLADVHIKAETHKYENQDMAVAMVIDFHSKMSFQYNLEDDFMEFVTSVSKYTGCPETQILNALKHIN